MADGAQIAFGDDQEVTLTHVADTGLLLSDDSGIGTTQLQFGDSASYIAQSSDGVLRIDGEVTIDLNASTAVTVSNDLKLDSDAAVLGFGVDNDVTLTHVADTGLLLNGAMALQFSDASQYINAPSATVLDINATDEIELNATAVDLNGTLDVSGTSTLTGNVSAGADIIIGATDKLRLDGSASGNTYFSESSADVVTLTTEGEDSFHLATGGGNPYIKLNALNTGIGSIQYWEENGSGTSEFKWQASVRGSDNNYYISDQTSGIESNYALMCTGSRAVAIGGDLTAPSASFSGQIDTTNMVGIGTTSPGSYYTTDLVIADTASGHTAGLTIANANDGQGRIDFADGTSGDARYRGTISYNHDSTPANGYMRFVAGGAEALRLGSNYILMANLPTSDPGVANSLYNDSGTLKISAG